MLNKSEITRLLKSQEERERELKRQLKWYFWNLKQYRNGGVICDCETIVPINTKCGCGQTPSPILKQYICKNCSKEFYSYKNRIFCNIKCNKEFDRRKSFHICNQCGRSFLKANSLRVSPHKFCNIKCYRKYRKDNS